MKRLSVLLLAAVLPVLLTGCFSLHYKLNSQKPILANVQISHPHTTQHFVENVHPFYLFWGLIPITSNDSYDVLRLYLEQHDGIVNLEQNEKFGILDTLLHLFTAGIVSSRTLKVEGDILTYNRPPGGSSTTIYNVPEGSTTIVPPGNNPPPPATNLPPATSQRL